MTSNQQRAALQRQIWAITNDVRGAVDGWDFKQFFWKMVPRRGMGTI
jgi:type I restriction enzyme M protein